MKYIELIRELRHRVTSGKSPIPVVGADELRHFWRTGWEDATTQAARDKELDLTKYAPIDRIAPLFLRCELLQQIADDGIETKDAVIEAVATAPFQKDFDFQSFVSQMRRL